MINSSETPFAQAATAAGETPVAVIRSTLESISEPMAGRGRRNSSGMPGSVESRRLSLWAHSCSAGRRKLICWIDRSASVSSARSSTSVDVAEYVFSGRNAAAIPTINTSEPTISAIAQWRVSVRSRSRKSMTLQASAGVVQQGSMTRRHGLHRHNVLLSMWQVARRHLVAQVGGELRRTVMPTIRSWQRDPRSHQSCRAMASGGPCRSSPLVSWPRRWPVPDRRSATRVLCSGCRAR